MQRSIGINIGDFILRGINLYLRSRRKKNKNRFNRESTLIYANKTKDVISEMQNASSVIEELKNLEVMYKKEIQATDTTIRGDAELGAFD